MRLATHRLPYVVAACLFVLLLGGYLAIRGLGGVRIIPITQRQVDEIVGDDLKWTPPVAAGQMVSAKELEKLAKDPVATSLWRKGKPPFRDDLIKIRAAWKVTQALEALIKGRTLGPNQPSTSMGVDAVERSMEIHASERQLAKLYSLQVGLETEMGDSRRCFLAARSAMLFEAFLCHSQMFDPIDLMTRQAARQILLSAVDKAALAGMFDPGQLDYLFEQVDPAPDIDVEWENAFVKGFAKETLPALVDLQKAPNLSGLITSTDDSDRDGLIAGELDMPATVQKAAEFARREIANSKQPWSRQDKSTDTELSAISKLLPKIPDIQPDDSWLKRTWEKAKFKGRMRQIQNSLGLYTLEQITLTGMLSISFRARTASEAHRLTLLIAEYEKLHGGSLPAKLDDLTPLSKGRRFPRDLYADAPFHYSSAKRSFWSVGENGVDDGGIGTPTGKGPDIVWSLP